MNISLYPEIIWDLSRRKCCRQIHGDELMTENYIDNIENHPLFYGIKKENMKPMLKCLGCYVKTFKKHENLILDQEPVNSVGLIISGDIHMVKENEDGAQTLLVHMKAGELFGETFACGSMRDSRVTFRTVTACKVLIMPFSRVIHTCSLTCVFHHRLIENIVVLLCDKNRQLIEKLEVTSRKTLRDKIMAYLNIQASRAGQRTFEIPLGRGELAEYLCADRSALTRELSRMQEDGLITYHKNIFSIMRTF